VSFNQRSVHDIEEYNQQNPIIAAINRSLYAVADSFIHCLCRGSLVVGGEGDAGPVSGSKKRSGGESSGEAAEAQPLASNSEAGRRKRTCTEGVNYNEGCGFDLQHTSIWGRSSVSMDEVSGLA
jgi:hypothetical protein